MKDLSNVEVKQGDIVYYMSERSLDLEIGEALEASENSVVVSPVRLVENEDGGQELHRLAVQAETAHSTMLFIIPGAAQRLSIIEPADPLGDNAPSRVAVERARSRSELGAMIHLHDRTKNPYPLADAILDAGYASSLSGSSSES